MKDFLHDSWWAGFFRSVFFHTREFCLRRFHVYCGLPWSLLGKIYNHNVRVCVSSSLRERQGTRSYQEARGIELSESLNPAASVTQGHWNRQNIILNIILNILKGIFLQLGVLTNLLEHVISPQEPMYEVRETEKLLTLPHSSWVLPSKYILTASVSTQVKCNQS